MQRYGATFVKHFNYNYKLITTKAENIAILKSIRGCRSNASVHKFQSPPNAIDFL